ncbi:MAG: NADH-quinone oxidoreductase subunit N, partial [Acidimicrobiia bacterium]|nr:NADH-quinone oxidoreductase subunit N [Acidimicrobiia bacterium]
MPPGVSLQDFYYILPEMVLALGSMLVLLADAYLARDRQHLLTGLSVGVLAVTAVAVLAIGAPDVTIARGLLSIDAFGVFFKLLFIGAAALALLMSGPYLTVEGIPAGAYCFLVLAATLGMMFMASGVELVTIFIGLETMAVAFYILAGYLKPNERSNEAAVKYFLLGAFSLGILLYGMSILYGLTGSTTLSAMATALADPEAVNRPLLLLGIVLVVAGVAFKIGAVPFHMWAPDVYEGSPTPITAFLSVGSKAASFAMLLRIFVEGLPSMSEEWRTLFYVLSILTMTVGNIAAITQTNVKRMLAYSSIAHAGYLLMGVVAGTPRGISAMLIYLGVYALMQMGAFAIVVLLRRRDAMGDDLKDFNGLYFRSPGAAIAMLVFMLSLGGIPPTAGFMGKFWLFGAAIESGYVWLAVIGVLNSAVSLYYYIRIVVFMWLKNEPSGSEPRMSPAIAVAVAVTLAGTLAL